MNTIVNGTTLFATYGLSSVFTAENYKKSGMALSVAMTNDQTTEFLGQILKGSKLPSPANMVHAQLNPDRATPLHVAVMLGRADYVEFLLANGANPELADSHGWLPYHHCALLVDKTIAQIFEKRGLGSKATTSGYTYATIRHAAGIERNPAMVQQKIYYNGQEVDYNHPLPEIFDNLGANGFGRPLTFCEVPHVPPAVYFNLWRTKKVKVAVDTAVAMAEFLRDPPSVVIVEDEDLKKAGISGQLSLRMERESKKGEVIALYTGGLILHEKIPDYFFRTNQQTPEFMSFPEANCEIDPAKNGSAAYYIPSGYPNAILSIDTQSSGTIPYGTPIIAGVNGSKSFRIYYGPNYQKLVWQYPNILIGKEEMLADFGGDHSPIELLTQIQNLSNLDAFLRQQRLLYVISHVNAVILLHIEGIVKSERFIDLIPLPSMLEVMKSFDPYFIPYMIGLWFALMEIDEKMAAFSLDEQKRVYQPIRDSLEKASARDLMIALSRLHKAPLESVLTVSAELNFAEIQQISWDNFFRKEEVFGLIYTSTGTRFKSVGSGRKIYSAFSRYLEEYESRLKKYRSL